MPRISGRKKDEPDPDQLRVAIPVFMIDDVEHLVRSGERHAGPGSVVQARHAMFVLDDTPDEQHRSSSASQHGRSTGRSAGGDAATGTAATCASPTPARDAGADRGRQVRNG